MIKGRYVGIIEIDICVDENYPGLLPFEKLKEVVHKETATVIKDMVEGEFDGFGTVSVHKAYADLYQVKEGD